MLSVNLPVSLVGLNVKLTEPLRSWPHWLRLPTDSIAGARKYAAGAGIAHGQSLMWGGESFGLQGVTVLTDCERCDDPWLREVQEDIRCGNLSADKPYIPAWHANVGSRKLVQWQGAM